MTEEINNSEEKSGFYSEFIAEYHNAMDSEWCSKLIDAFDYYHDVGGVYCENDQFTEGSAGRFDWSIDLFQLQTFIEGSPILEFNQMLWQSWAEYVSTYGHIKHRPMYSTHLKIQKTPAGGGYHVWHDESGDLDLCQRSLVWMMYLNDDYEGGETEFLYQHKRIKPETGKLLIWPSGFTHAHRGGLVTEGTKYVITGWFVLGGSMVRMEGQPTIGVNDGGQ